MEEEESWSWTDFCGAVSVIWEGAELGEDVVMFAEAVEVEGFAGGDGVAMLRSIGSLMVFGTAGAARWRGALENQGSCMFDGVSIP